MDAGGTHFHALLGRRDWSQQVCEAVVWDAERLGLTLRPRLQRVSRSPADPPLSPGQRRGAARDRFGNTFWISADGSEIRVQRAGSEQVQRLWPEPEAEPLRPPAPAPGAFRPVPPAGDGRPRLRGLAITASHYLVAGQVEPAGLLLFDLYLGGPPTLLRWPGPLDPVDLAPAPDGGVWVLDRAGGLCRSWALDRSLRLGGPAPGPGAAFGPVSEPPPRPAAGHAGPANAVALPVPDPVALQALPDGSLLVLSAAAPGRPATLTRFVGGQVAGSVPLLLLPEQLAEERSEPYPLQAFALAFLPDPAAPAGAAAGTLYVATLADAQCFAFALEAGPGRAALQLRARLEFIPMHHAGGRGLVAGADGVYYDCQGRWLRLQPQPRPRYDPEGTVTTVPLDGGEENCVWHRLFLDAVIPAETAVQVQTRASNDPEIPDDLPWQAQPAPYLRPRGAELPYYQAFRDGGEGAGTWELFLHGARGRFLQIRLTLTGSGRRSPFIRALRVWYPRLSYLTRYLPDVYQEDAASAAFLEGFLGNAEGILTALADRIDQVRLLFNPAVAPAECLEWLAGWFGVMLDYAWEERRRRLFLAHLFDFYRWRGTLWNLVRAIRLATDPEPDERIFRDDPRPYVGLPSSAAQHFLPFRIVEGYRTRQPAAAPPADAAADPFVRRQFQQFLRGRYKQVERFNQAFGLTGQAAYASFRQIPVPGAGDPAWPEWQEFQTQYLPLVRGAHCFTILLPRVVAGHRLPRPIDEALLRRIVDLERPAHTLYDVRTYWALCAVGTARLGLDTAVGESARLVALVLGEGELGRSYLGFAYPWNAADRWVVGRDRVGS